MNKWIKSQNKLSLWTDKELINVLIGKTIYTPYEEDVAGLVSLFPARAKTEINTLKSLRGKAVANYLKEIELSLS